MRLPNVSEKVKEKILHRDGFSCVFCNFSPPSERTILEIAHIKPKAKPGYGSNKEDNLISLCPNCHTLMDRLQCICIDPESFEIVTKPGFESLLTNFAGSEHRSYLRSGLSKGSLEFRYSMVLH